jgi:hypothetical protein
MYDKYVVPTVVCVDSVSLPQKGLAVARLKRDFWLEYATGITAWTAHWQRTKLSDPSIGNIQCFPRSVSLAVDEKGALVATVLYDNGVIMVAELVQNPVWHTVPASPWN